MYAKEWFTETHSIFKSKTFWIQIITIVYVLVTGNVEAAKPLHINDHWMFVINGAVNIINRFFTTEGVHVL